MCKAQGTGDTLGEMQLMQVLFAAGSASELILLAYVYAVTDRKSYQAVTVGGVGVALVAICRRLSPLPLPLHFPGLTCPRTCP